MASCVGFGDAESGLFCFYDEVFFIFTQGPATFLEFGEFFDFSDAYAGYVVGS